DVYLSPGIYDYEITYETLGQIGFLEDLDELYWNATGTDWVFPIDKVITKLNLPADILQDACYTGEAGSTARNCSALKTSPKSIEWQSDHLMPYEGLTVAAGFTKGVIQEPEIPAFLKTE